MGLGEWRKRDRGKWGEKKRVEKKCYVGIHERGEKSGRSGRGKESVYRCMRVGWYRRKRRERNGNTKQTITQYTLQFK